MVWLLVGAVSWFAVALVVALLVGRAIRLVDERRILPPPVEANVVASIPRPRPPLEPGATPDHQREQKPGGSGPG